MKEHVRLTVVIPVFNETGIIEILYNRLYGIISEITDDYEFIFVNDGSQDNSYLEILQLAKIDNNVLYINLSRNFGHQAAVSAGLDFASGDCIVIIDSDLQDPPELISKMYEKYKNGFDVVYAKRKSRAGETIFKKFTSKLFYRLLKRLTSFEIPLDTGDYRLIDRRVVNALKDMPEKDKYLRGQIAWLGFKQTFVLFDRAERKIGKTGYTYRKMLKLALDGITGFSDRPLTFVSKCGFIISFCSLLIILYTIFAHFVLKQTVTGWSSLIISSMFIGGIQLFSIGIIGEYISRINNNTRGRPLYVISNTNIENRKRANLED